VHPPPHIDAPAIPERSGPTAEQLRFGRGIAEGMRREWVTDALLAANVLVFVWMVISGVSALSPDGRVLIDWGANFGPLTRGPEVWRLVTSMFVHGGIIHLGFNMYALLMAGRLVERIYGHAGYAILYLFAGVAGSTASAFVNPMVASVGASGAVFGVFGALLAFLVRRRSLIAPEVVRPMRRSVITVVLLNVALGFTVPGIDNAAHLGGLAGGFMAGLALAPGVAERGVARPWLLYPVVMAAILGLVLWVATTPVFG
jgi:rhomboid protease GluP